MTSCINCENDFERFEKRGTLHRYKGYYCKECHDHMREHGELP